MNNPRIYIFSPTVKLVLSVAILSASIVAYEIQLMHFFTIVQWYHFASMVISIALLGFGASGTLLSLYRKKMLQRASWLLPLFMIRSGIFCLLYTSDAAADRPRG